MPIRALSSTLQKIAEEELNEVPSRVPEDIAHIRKWLAQQPHLHKVNPDDQLILNFLRGNKFSLQNTKKKLDMMYTMRSLAPEIFSNRDPFLPEIQDILKHGIWLPLAKINDEGSNVILSRTACVDTETMSFVNGVKVLCMIYDILVHEGDNVVQIHVITDLQGLSFKHIAAINIDVARKGSICLEKAYPVRVKGLHHINGPPLVESFLNIVRPLTPEKLRNRIFVYSEKNMNGIYNNIPASLFPKEYGGNGMSLDELTGYWKTEVERRRDWYLKEEKICSDETKRTGSLTISEDLFGVEGSFRKLTVD